MPDTHPYGTWLFFQENGSVPQREHTPDRATMLMAIQRPFGASTPSDYSQLRFMNALASRNLTATLPHIEYAPVLVQDINDPNSTFDLVTTNPASPGCNVPRPVRVESRKLEIRDDVTPPILPRRRLLRFTASTKKSNEIHRVVPPAPGSDGDPTLHGATLAIVNTSGTGEVFVADLAPGLWTRIGSPANPKGWKWRSVDPAWPVSLVQVKFDNLKVRAGDAAFEYTLDESAQGSVGLRLTLGDGGWSYCADVPARTKGDPPSADKYDQPGRFSGAKNAAPPAFCPLLGE